MWVSLLMSCFTVGQDTLLLRKEIPCVFSDEMAELYTSYYADIKVIKSHLSLCFVQPLRKPPNSLSLKKTYLTPPYSLLSTLSPPIIPLAP